MVNDGACKTGAAAGKSGAANGPAKYEACERPTRQASTMATCWYILKFGWFGLFVVEKVRLVWFGWKLVNDDWILGVPHYLNKFSKAFHWRMDSIATPAVA